VLSLAVHDTPNHLDNHYRYNRTICKNSQQFIHI